MYAHGRPLTPALARRHWRRRRRRIIIMLLLTSPRALALIREIRRPYGAPRRIKVKGRIRRLRARGQSTAFQYGRHRNAARTHTCARTVVYLILRFPPRRRPASPPPVDRGQQHVPPAQSGPRGTGGRRRDGRKSDRRYTSKLLNADGFRTLIV